MRSTPDRHPTIKSLVCEQKPAYQALPLETPKCYRTIKKENRAMRNRIPTSLPRHYWLIARQSEYRHLISLA